MLDKIKSVTFYINDKKLLETNESVTVGDTKNFYNPEHSVIQLTKEGSILKVNIKIQNIRKKL